MTTIVCRTFGDAGRVPGRVDCAVTHVGGKKIEDEQIVYHTTAASAAAGGCAGN